MSIVSFTEKEIRNAILKKVKPCNEKNETKHGKHDKVLIFCEYVLVTTVKLPNEHLRIMHKNKSKFIADALMLSGEDFNELIGCTLTGSKYYDKLVEKTKTSKQAQNNAS